MFPPEGISVADHLDGDLEFAKKQNKKIIKTIK